MNDTTIDHGARAHSKIVGGSTADRVINCPASVLELDALPEVDTSNEHSERGTALHEAMEFFLGSDDAPETIDELAGMIFNKHEIDAELLGEALIPAAKAFDYYSEMCSHEGGLEYALETRVEITDMPVEGVFGTCDIIGRTERRTVIWDWKFGRNPVSARENKQGLFYGAGALCTMPDMFNADDDEWPVDIIICQPAAYPEDKVCYDRWTTTVGRLLDFTDELEDAIKVALNDPNPTRKRGKHCDYARCKLTCPLHVAPMTRIASLGERLSSLRDAEAGSDVVTINEQTGTETVRSAEEELALQYGVALDLCDVIEPWIKKIRDDAHAMLEAGHPVYGFKLVPKRASRTGWTDEKKAANLLRSVKLGKADMVTEKFITPAAAEKLLKAKGIVLDEKKAKLFAELSPATSSGNTLAASDDPRPVYKGFDDKLADLSTKLLKGHSSSQT